MRISPLVTVFFCAAGIAARPVPAQISGRDAVPSAVTLIDVDGKSTQVILQAPRRLEAPNWSPDGSYLLLNSDGRLWRLPAGAKGGRREADLRAVPTPSINWVDINHGLAPGGRWLALTAGPIYVLPAAGGVAKQVTAQAPSWFHGWSPDARVIAYSANRGNGIDLFTVDAAGGPERRLTTHPALDDAPDFSPDGRWIYFNSDRSGNSDIWRMPADGAGPADAKAERVTGDDFQDWFPHPSPDGKWLIFLSYSKDLTGHPTDEDVAIRRLPLPGTRVVEGKPEEVVRFVGGHGSIGSDPWSPDGRRFTYVRFEPPPPMLHIVFFTPSDVSPPPDAAVRHRLTQAADAAERFLVSEMKRRSYPPAVERIFPRRDDGLVKILYVKGDEPLASGRYQKPTFAGEVIEKATRRYGIKGEKHLWWIFTFMGDPPKRIDEYRGHGDPWDGGWAIVNYSTISGEISTKGSLAKGFNDRWTLKGIIHELGHAFGLPHIGPNASLGLGNSLMGPNNSVYAERKLPKPDQVYLTEAAAAMLWKHPVFSGSNQDRARRPVVTLREYKPTFSRTRKVVTLAGKVASAPPPHSVFVLDDLGNSTDEYWYRSYTARVADDGTFQVVIDPPAPAAGTYRILFCFDNGAIAGDHKQPGYYGAILKTYRYRGGRYEFGK